MRNWKKAESEEGFFYYINTDTNVKQWDHPKFSDIKQAIDDCNYVTYPLYRLALKFRVVQRSLFMEEIPLSIIVSIFERHRLGNSESTLTLEACDLEAVLLDIFAAANQENHSNIDIDFATEIVINFLFNVYDRFRERAIPVFATRTLLAILSNCSLLDMYKFLFSLCADHNNCITRLRLQGLLLKIFEVIKYFYEDVSLGLHHINSTIESCFRTSPGLVGITESNFIGWLETNPFFLSWLSLIAKFKSSEAVMHSVKCTTCKTRPLMGLRYNCIKCSRYVQCQTCFLTGRISHSHKLSHSVREYGGVNISKDSSRVFFGNISGLFCPCLVDTNFEVVRPSRCFTTENLKSRRSVDHLPDVEPLSSPQSQLQGVIRQLESQNRELQQMLMFGNHSDKEIRKYLEEYRIFMAGNIKKLKVLKNRIITAMDSDVTKYKYLEFQNVPNMQSTPRVHLNNKIANSTSPANAMSEMYEGLSKDYVDINRENEEIDFKTQACSNSEYIKSCHKGVGCYPVSESTNLEAKCDLFVKKSPVKLLHNDLDEALARLQQILANNFPLEDCVNPMDNTNLKYAVTEVEGMLTSIIDKAESSRSSSALPSRIK